VIEAVTAGETFVKSKLEPIHFDAAARLQLRARRRRRGQRRKEAAKPMRDLLTATTAHANRLDLYTRNGDHFTGLEGLVRVIAI
jgi:predicted nucleic acid-binding protein